MVGITATRVPVSPDTSAGSVHPSLLLDNNECAAMAWIHTATDCGEVRFLRAVADPTVRENWKNAQGTSTVPDVLGTQVFANLTGPASLARMPAGTQAGANDDALYLFWVESQAGRLYWSKATVQGATYTAWTAATERSAAYVGPWTLATAADASGQGIVVAHYTETQQNRVYRVPAQQDTTWQALAPESTGFLGWAMSVGVDRGDVYVFSMQSPTNSLVYRRYLAGPGWDGSDRAIDPVGTPTSTPTVYYPTTRLDLSDGQADVAYKRTLAGANEVVHHRFAVSRPFIRNLSASPAAFLPTAGQSTTISYTLADDLSTSLSVTVRVHNSGGTAVRTLVSGSQATGNRSAVWDGTDDSGALVPPGGYTVKVNATDGDLLAAPEQTVGVTRQATIGYGYDALSRLTSVTTATDLTSYGYDPVGNRLARTRGGTPTAYTYDKADHLRTVGGLTYTVNDNGNLTDPGTGLAPEPYGYDQANRLTSARVGSTTTTYRYDGDGKRVSTTVGTNPAVNYLYDVNRSLPVLLSDGTRTYVWGLGLVYSVEGSAPNEVMKVYHSDGLGSVRAMTEVEAQCQAAVTRHLFDGLYGSPTRIASDGESARGRGG